MTSNLPPIVQAVSGAVGSAAANALTYPLDLVATRIQLADSQDKKLKGFQGAKRVIQLARRKDGFLSLYTGLETDTCATLLSNFLYFYFYAEIRRVSGPNSMSKPLQKDVKVTTAAAFREFLTGYIAALASRAISTPLNVITVRLQAEDERADKDRGLMSTIKTIYREGGLAAFWKGFDATLFVSLNPTLSLALYQLFRRVLVLFKNREIRRHGHTHGLSKGSQVLQAIDPTPIEAFWGGAISNAIAVVIFYPLILAKTRLQRGRANDSLKNVLQDLIWGPNAPSLPASLKEDAHFRRLYQGIEIQTLKGFINQGVTLLVKGRIEQLVVRAYLHSIRKHRI